MREIDNNMSTGVNFKGGIQPVPQKDENQNSQQQTFSQPEESEKINDLSQMFAASLGKSQIAPDNINNNMAVYAKKPELTQELVKIIDEYSKTHTQEETLQFMDTTIHEFYSKK